MKQRALDQLLAHHADAQEQVQRLLGAGSALATSERTLEMCFMPLAGLSFAGKTVRNIDLRGADLRGADFTGATIERVLLPLARLDDANFTNARMTNISFQGSDAQRVVFTGANVERFYMRDMRFRKSSFDRSTLANATIHESRLNESHFAGAMLRNVTLRDAGLTASEFSEATFERVNAAGTRFLRCGFTDSRLLDFRAGPRAATSASPNTAVALPLNLNSGSNGQRLQRIRQNLSALQAAGIVTRTPLSADSSTDEVAIERVGRIPQNADAAAASPARFKNCDFARTQFEQCDLSHVLAGDSNFDGVLLIASTPFADFAGAMDGVMVLRSAPTPAHLAIAKDAALKSPGLARLGTTSTLRSL